MPRLVWKAIVCLFVLLIFSASTQAQNATYHLHKEASSTTGLFQLKTAGPDGTSLAVQSADLKNQPVGEYLIKAFDTQAGVPNASGIIPAGSTITYTLWMKKTATFGSMVPRAKVYRNNTAGTLLCTATGATALTTTLTKYTLTCTTSSAITMAAADRFYLWVGVNLTTAPGANTVKGEVDVEGTLNGNFDSLIVVPLPVPQPNITGLTPSSGSVGQSVTISGTNFGSTQGSSTVKFNGVSATPTSWGATSIAAPVPAGATSGPVVVTVSGVSSNGVTFTVVTTGTIAGTITRASDGTPLNGALAEALQSNVVKGSATSNASGAYSIGSLPAGVYDVRFSATGYVTDLKTGFSVAAGGTTTVNDALTIIPGTISGRVTQSDGTTAIAGATIKVYQGTTVAGTTTTNGSGDYSASLPPATYTMEASAIGYEAQSRFALAVSSGATTTANFSLVAARITYTYDELGRLVGVTDPSGDTAIYNYDAVGNLLSVSRQNSNLPSIIEFTPNGGAIGTSVTISGTGFSPTLGFNTVKFNGVTATVTAVSATQIMATVPTGATTGPITLITPAGSVTSAASFTVGTPPGWPTITGVSPNVSDTTTTVTITGANFEPIPTNNKVYFYGNARGTVTAASPTSLTVTVPATAGNGHIRVLTPSGEAVSSGDFFYFSPPSRVEVAARMAVGDTRTITFPTSNTPSKVAILIYDGTAGQKLALNITGVTIGTSSCCSATMNNVFFGTSGLFYEFPPLSAAGTYGFIITPNDGNTGSATLFLLNVPPDFTATITPGGPTVTATTTAPAQNAKLTFSGTSGQRVSLNLSSVTIGTSFCCGAQVSILNPDGSALLASTNVGTNGLQTDPLSLPATGTYTIFIDPVGTNTGSATVKLYDVPADVNTTITPGGPTVTVTISAPSQNANLTFTGVAGHRISLLMISTLAGGTGFQTADLYIYNPDGSTLVTYGLFGSDNFLTATTLPTSGTYRIFLDPRNQYTGTVDFTLFDVPADVTGSITPGGAAVAVTITTPGQKANLTFNGTAGQRVSLKLSNVTITNAYVSILDPSGFAIVSGVPIDTNGGFIDPVTLSAAGVYTVVVETGLTSNHTVATGNITLTLYNVPADTTGSVTVGGAAVPVTISVPGQNGQLTFSGAANQQVTVHVTSNTMGAVTVSLLDANGSTLTSSTSSSASFNLARKTLTAAGTYTVRIDPNGANTGSLSISVSSP